MAKGKKLANKFIVYGYLEYHISILNLVKKDNYGCIK